MAMTFNSEDMFKAIEEIQGPIGKKKFGPDERFWKLSRNKDDNGAAQIRLMPNVIEKDGSTKLVPFVRIFENELKLFDKITQKTKYYIEDSPATVGKPCAFSDLFYEVGKIDTELAKDLKSKMKRKAKFYTNITVVNDPIATENTGRIALWRYGTKLNDKFNELMNPSDTDIQMGAVPVPLYDLVKGSTFNLKIKRAGDFLNYDSSDKGPQGPLKDFKSQEEVEEYIRKGVPLTEWIKEETYLTYEQQIEKLKRVLDGSDYEKMLRDNGSFLYASDTQTEQSAPVQPTPTQVPVQETVTVVQETVTPTAPVVETPSMDMNFQSGSDDLDFLDGI